MYKRRASGVGVVDLVGIVNVVGLRASSRSLGAAKAVALPRVGSKLVLSSLNCF